MPTITRGRVTVEYDENTLTVLAPPRRQRGGPRRIPTTGTASESPVLAGIDNEAVVSALADRLELVDTVSLAPVGPPTTPVGRRGVGGPSAPQTTSIRVEVGPEENAVVLVEQDGYYAWIAGQAIRTAGRRRGGANTVVEFVIAMDPNAAAVRRRGERGFTKSALFRPVTALIFKFVAEVALGQLVKRLEQHIVPGLVHITGSDPATWAKLPGSADLSLPQGRRANVLLLVHGTFSSTRGGFGALSATATGVAFLANALEHYDAVVGFDHRTLSEDPLENAEQLHSALRAVAPKHGVDVDVVTHSRGSLVARSLAEHLVPKTPDVDVRRVIMVAGPNDGTLLASSEKWDALVDIYTNLVVAGCRLITVAAPQLATATIVLTEGLTAISTLVKALVASAVRDDGKAPGLAAMTPPGAFITEINRTQSDQPAVLDYRSISSDFNIGRLGGPAELPARLKFMITDGLVDRLMGESNDLVVNVASMTAVDGPDSRLVSEKFEFGDNSRVYHTNYFLQPEVHRALSTWLGVGTSAAGRGRTRRPRPHSGPPDLASAAITLSNAVDRGFLVVDANLSIGVADRLVRQSDHADFAIVRRYDAPNRSVYHYPLLVDEFETMFAGLATDQTIEGAGVLHEWQASMEVPPGPDLSPAPGFGGAPWSARQVVMLDGSPVGVVRALGEPAIDLRTPTQGRQSSGLEPSPPIPTPRRSRRGPGPETTVGSGTTTRGPGAPEASGGRPVRTSTGRAARAKPVVAPRETQFHAEMDDVVEVGHETMVMVDVTVDDLQRATRPGAASGHARVAPEQDLVLHVIPRLNFTVVGANHAVIPPPSPGQPRMVGFTVTASAVGPGEIAVVAMQGPIILVKLILTPRIVKPQDLPKAGAQPRASSSVSAPPPPRVEPCDQLWIEENKIVAVDQNAGAGSLITVQTAYDVRYQSESLDVQERAATKAIKGDRLSYVRALFARIEQDWGNSARDAERFTRALREYGGQLFDELVPEPIQKTLWDNRDKIHTIQVNSEDPLIPWELVHLKGPGGKLPREERFLANMGLVRWIDNAGIAPRAVTVRRGRARVLAPTYPIASGWELASTADEQKFLQDNFGAKPVEASVEKLLDLIQTPGNFDLLHFAGHGLAQSDDISNAQIIIGVTGTAGNWRPMPFSSTTVEQSGVLRNVGGNRPVVFLNACQVGRAGYQLTGIGGFANAFLRSGAGVFVSTLWSVGDEPARAFGENFYTELSGGATIAEASVIARQRSRVAGDPSWLAYVVYGRPEGKVKITRKSTSAR